MTTNQSQSSGAQYCGSDDLGLGWQHGEALVTYKKHGTPGQPASVSDLPPLWSCGVSVGGGVPQFPPIK